MNAIYYYPGAWEIWVTGDSTFHIESRLASWSGWKPNVSSDVEMAEAWNAPSAVSKQAWMPFNLQNHMLYGYNGNP